MLCSSAPFPHKSNHKAYLLYTDLVHTIMVTLLTTENVQSSVFEHRKDIFSIRCSKVNEGKLTFFKNTDTVWSNMVEHNVMLFSVLSIFILFLTYIADSVACKKPLFCIRFAKKKKGGHDVKVMGQTLSVQEQHGVFCHLWTGNISEMNRDRGVVTRRGGGQFLIANRK